MIRHGLNVFDSNFIKFANSWETNCSPLLVTTCSGTPYAANSCLSSSMVLVEVVLAISITSSHFECASVTSRNILFRKGPAKSTSMVWWARAMDAVEWSVEYSLLLDIPSKNVPILQYSDQLLATIHSCVLYFSC